MPHHAKAHTWYVDLLSLQLLLPLSLLLLPLVGKALLTSTCASVMPSMRPHLCLLPLLLLLLLPLLLLLQLPWHCL